MPKLCAPIEAMLRAKTKITDEEKLKETIDEEKNKVKNAKESLQPYITYFGAIEKYREKYINELEECLKIALEQEFNDKDTLADFNFRVKRLS